MGCCQKRKKSQYLLNKTNKPLKEPNDEKDFTTITINISYQDFIPLKLLGRGSFGQVCLVRLKINNKLYAMKILDKKLLKERNQELHTKSERDLMVKINCPFIVNIKSAFQDEKYLYIISDFMQGGDLFYHMHESRIFNFELAQFYTAEIVLALEYLHKNNMIYRDLKPENILLDSNGHIKLTDFGLSKLLNTSKQKAFTICGTIQYIAPEVFINKGYDKMVDWWSLGCLIYEMFVGKFAFDINNRTRFSLELYNKKLKFPRHMDEDAKDLINKLLVVDPKKRLGYGIDGCDKSKNHQFFEGVNWNEIWHKQIVPPFKPELDDELDLKYFDTQFTEEPIESFTKNPRSRECSYEYKNFTYVTDSVKNDFLNVAQDDIIQNDK